MVLEPDPQRLGARSEPIVKGNETIYEIVRREAGFGFGLTLVRIEGEWNEAHYHDKTTEIYVVVWGALEVKVARLGKGNQPDWPEFGKHVGPRQALTIPPRRAHQSRAQTFHHAWVYVYTFPPFDPNDYHPLT